MLVKQSDAFTRIFDRDGANPQFNSATGSRTLLYVDNFSILVVMGALLLRLERGALSEPHWHPTAAELAYFISGSTKMTI
jgi:oxalate decarboxylase